MIRLIKRVSVPSTEMTRWIEKIPVLEGEANYDEWYTAVNDGLEQNDVETYAYSDVPRPQQRSDETAAAFQKRKQEDKRERLLAYKILRLSVPLWLVPSDQGEDGRDPRKLWVAITEKVPRAQKFHLLAEYFNMRAEAFETMEEFLDRSAAVRQHLQSEGTVISEHVHAYHLFKGVENRHLEADQAIFKAYFRNNATLNDVIMHLEGADEGRRDAYA